MRLLLSHGRVNEFLSLLVAVSIEEDFQYKEADRPSLHRSNPLVPAAALPQRSLNAQGI